MNNLEKLKNEDQLTQLLLDRAMITEAELALVKQQTKASGLEMWRVLLNLNLVNPDELNALLSGEELDVEKAQARAKEQQANGQAGAAFRTQLSAAADAGDMPDLVGQIFGKAFDSRATDIHFDPQDESKLRIRYRIDGDMHDALFLPAHMTASVISRLKIMAGMDIIEKRDSQDGHILADIDGKQRNIRVATIPTNRGERVVARLLDEQAVSVGLDKLGFDEQQIKIVNGMLKRTYGIIIVTGPVGSGKTTTLYSCLNRLNLPSRNLMTVEDPVEYNLSGVNQMQVDAKVDWTFPKALRAMMRQDPDVMMVGEVRDDETAKIAVRASLTGVLVLTSTHANDAASTIGNLYNYGMPGYLISSSLIGVIAQRLIRKVNPESAEDFVPDDKIRKLLRLEEGSYPDLKIKRAKGTGKDFGTGYLGRTGVYEVFELNDVLRDMIFRETTKEVIRELAVDMGMKTIAQHAIDKVLSGVTTVEEVFRVALLDTGATMD